MRRIAPLALLLALGACALPPPPPTASLPRVLTSGVQDPTRAAIFATAYGLNRGGIEGRAADVAVLAAQYEFLTVDLPWNPLFAGMPPLVGMQLETGRAELRAALAVAPDAPPQAVINGLVAAAEALGGGRDPAAALPQEAFPAPATTLARLAALPPTPLAGRAAAAAQSGLWQMQNRGGRLWMTRAGGGAFRPGA
jgi:hypothetical protein